MGVLTVVWYFDNVCTCIYCSFIVCTVFVLFRLCIFILIYYSTTATE